MAILLPSGSTNILNRLLIAPPKELYKLNELLMKQLIPGYMQSELSDFLAAKAIKRKSRDIYQTILYNKYQNVFALLTKIFDYDGQISNNKSRAYEIAKRKGRNSCTYCNRQYSQTIVRDGGSNDSDRIARPHLDHWFSKELFPLMSLSFYNLIPSCPTCNSAVKGNSIFNFSTHIHPHLNIPTKFKFSYRPKIGGDWEVTIDDTSADPKEKRMIKDFYLHEIYSYHSDLELKDIMDFALANNETYLNTLLEQTLMRFPGKSKADVYRMFFGTEPFEDDFLDRPMSKFKHDILKEIGVIIDERNFQDSD
jgi:hypothetical protein